MNRFKRGTALVIVRFISSVASGLQRLAASVTRCGLGIKYGSQDDITVLADLSELLEMLESANDG